MIGFIDGLVRSSEYIENKILKYIKYFVFSYSY